MSNPLALMIDGICASLKERVLPKVDDDGARGQILAALYLLSAMKTRSDWGEQWIRQHLAIHQTAFASIRELSAGQYAATMPTVPFEAVPESCNVSYLVALRDAADEYLISLQDWIDKTPSSPERESIVRIVRVALMAQANLEVDLTPRPIYAQVAKGDGS